MIDFQRSVGGFLLMLASLAWPHLASGQGAAAGGLQGGITVDGRKTELRYGYAVNQKSLISGAPETILVATDKLLPEAVVADRNGRKQARERDGVRMLEVALDKRPDDVTSIFIWVEPVRTTSSTRRHKLELQSAGDKRVKGRLSMEEPWELFGNHYRIDLRFDVPVVAGK